MKNKFKLLGIATFYVIGALTLSSCGNAEESHDHDSMEDHEHATEEAHEHSDGEMHDHENMEMEGMEDHADMDMSEGMKVMECTKWEDGDHQHATYVCPMWEEEGEMEEAGDCSKCGMTLVAFADVKEQHDSQNPEGEAHEDHDHEN